MEVAGQRFNLQDAAVTELPVHITIRGFSLKQPWRRTPGWIEGLLNRLSPDPLGKDAWHLELPNGQKHEGVSLADAARRMESGKTGSYKLQSARMTNWLVTLTDYGPELDVQVEGVHHPEGVRSLEGEMQRAAALNAHVMPVGRIGPVYWISLPSIQYPRPLPPRISGQWVPGVIAYVLSRAFYASGAESIDPAALRRIEGAPPPDELIRENVDDDLVAVRGRGPLDDRTALRRQLSAMEAWIGQTLGLPQDQEFLDTGDQLWRVWKSTRIPPFSFFDEATRIGYKVVAETATHEIDTETLTELRAVLPVRALSDGRPVDSTMVIFAFREGAVRNLGLVRDLGAAGALYRDEKGAFWNPEPGGEWRRDR